MWRLVWCVGLEYPTCRGVSACGIIAVAAYIPLRRRKQNRYLRLISCRHHPWQKLVPETGTGSPLWRRHVYACAMCGPAHSSPPSSPLSLRLVRVFGLSLQYALSIVIVSTCVSNGTSNWLQVQYLFSFFKGATNFSRRCCDRLAYGLCTECLHPE